MYIETVPNRASPPAILLRESSRVGQKVHKRTLANLSHWPAAKIEALRQALRSSGIPAPASAPASAPPQTPALAITASLLVSLAAVLLTTGLLGQWLLPSAPQETPNNHPAEAGE